MNKTTFLRGNRGFHRDLWLNFHPLKLKVVWDWDAPTCSPQKSQNFIWDFFKEISPRLVVFGWMNDPQENTLRSRVVLVESYSVLSVFKKSSLVKNQLQFTQNLKKNEFESGQWSDHVDNLTRSISCLVGGFKYFWNFPPEPWENNPI